MATPQKVKRKQKTHASVQQRARKRGAYFEYEVAKKIGGVRVGRSRAVKVGTQYIDVDPQKPPDVVSLVLSVECKYEAELQKGITEPLAQACRNAPKGLMPVVFAGDRRGDRVVMMREKDFLSVITQPPPVNALSRGSQGHPGSE